MEQIEIETTFEKELYCKDLYKSTTYQIFKPGIYFGWFWVFLSIIGTILSLIVTNFSLIGVVPLIILFWGLLFTNVLPFWLKYRIKREFEKNKNYQFPIRYIFTVDDFKVQETGLEYQNPIYKIQKIEQTTHHLILRFAKSTVLLIPMKDINDSHLISILTVAKAKHVKISSRLQKLI